MHRICKYTPCRSLSSRNPSSVPSLLSLSGDNLSLLLLHLSLSPIKVYGGSGESAVRCSAAVPFCGGQARVKLGRIPEPQHSTATSSRRRSRSKQLHLPAAAPRRRCSLVGFRACIPAHAAGASPRRGGGLSCQRSDATSALGSPPHGHADGLHDADGAMEADRLEGDCCHR